MSDEKKCNEIIKFLNIFALATDPIYIGTGGYTIGRVDNTIVRDPITNVPKIPGSSLAGTWRYYVTLEIHKYFNDDDLRINKEKRKEEIEKFIKSKGKEKWEELNDDQKNEGLKKLFKDNSSVWILFEGNRFIGIKCAGQDDAPNVDRDNENNTGHCGHCIVCKGFGFSKKDISWQGMLFFSDLNILFFPVFTMKGTKWITTKKILEDIIKNDEGNTTSETSGEKICIVFEKLEETETEGHINLGWLYLPYKLESNEELKKKISFILKNLHFNLSLEDIIIVPESLFSHIVNSNLEVRTSVSIDPITGAAKEGALFTSEAIPRGTIFYGNIRIFDKKSFEDLEDKIKPLPSVNYLENALKDSAHYYESLGIGGMTTRGFGRLKISSSHWKSDSEKLIHSKWRNKKNEQSSH